MSRIGRMHITIPAGVTVNVEENNLVTVKGPKGTLSQKISKLIKAEQKDGQIVLTAANDSREANMQHGLARSLVNNMVVGVNTGFEKKLTMIGVGYRAEYILFALRDILNCKIVLEDISKLPDDKLFEVLTSMRGVGTKVANCTMLFGFARTNSFAIDVWIQRILDKYYGGKFDTTPYVGTAGIMQQFMFFYERNKI